MTQEEKQLLLQDLCARLPYGVKANIPLVDGDERIYTVSFDDMKDFIEGYLNIKPCLRPMSSMTEEESMEFTKLFDKWNDDELFDYIEEGVEFSIWKHKGISAVVFDWLNKKMFDYRGLIEKGLALEAPENC